MDLRSYFYSDRYLSVSSTLMIDKITYCVRHYSHLPGLGYLDNSSGMLQRNLSWHLVLQKNVHLSMVET